MLIDLEILDRSNLESLRMLGSTPTVFMPFLTDAAMLSANEGLDPCSGGGNSLGVALAADPIILAV